MDMVASVDSPISAASALRIPQRIWWKSRRQIINRKIVASLRGVREEGRRTLTTSTEQGSDLRFAPCGYQANTVHWPVFISPPETLWLQCYAVVFQKQVGNDASVLKHMFVICTNICAT